MGLTPVELLRLAQQAVALIVINIDNPDVGIKAGLSIYEFLGFQRRHQRAIQPGCPCTFAVIIVCRAWRRPVDPHLIVKVCDLNKNRTGLFGTAPGDNASQPMREASTPGNS